MESNHIASLRQLPFPLVKLIEPGIGFRIGDETREFSLAGTAGETWTFTDATTGLQVALSLQVVDQAVVVSGVLQNSGSAPASGIRKLDLRWSRWDYNIEPMPFWKELDPTLKIQFEYFAGLYRVLDTLMEEHPNWMVEGCASGGRRIDIGTMKRAHTYWFSDQTEIAAVCRYMQARANRFLPGHLLNSSVAVAVGAGDEGFSDTSVLSRMLGKLAFDGDIGGWSPAFTVRMGSWVAVFKAIRHLGSPGDQ